ncbi:MAG TPA: carbamoyltransferase HypF [Candidatus Baltobacteraceae bacterium]|jgi:hydrogenase maturation protein HypF|nr:carbamoyltransferase HypF [Candidatus Baltobacteraceae bacterium]
MHASTVSQARRFIVTGTVQGVGFRPFVYRIAAELGIAGWVLNEERGVEIHAEGTPDALTAFADALLNQAPPAAQVTAVDSDVANFEGYSGFEIRASRRGSTPTVRVSPDLPVCDACLRELFDPADRRYRYPYINCTACGPRYSIVRSLPYDRPCTTMRDWVMCDFCRREYDDPANRRFHAQPVACPQCGPTFVLESDVPTRRGDAAIRAAAQLLRDGAILGIKGIGGYHLACDADNARAVLALRSRKFRKERPFAVMVAQLSDAQAIVELDEDAKKLLQSPARPIVLAPAIRPLEGVAPDNDELGVMLAYTPLHHLLFNDGAPGVLVMTSANRSSEPIAYEDPHARESLRGIADALLVGEREIARRVDDSITRGARGSVLRRSRGMAPGSVARLPAAQSILAVGADLKNAVALVVAGQTFVSQHIGDLEHFEARRAFRETVDDLCALYEVAPQEAVIAYDSHPEYASTALARELGGTRHVAVQHHRAHIASVLAEHQCFQAPVLGFAFDGTGYGEDGTIWGGEVFYGSLRTGLERVAHLRTALLPGGDAAARYPVQAAAGFLDDVDAVDFTAAPFGFPERYAQARDLLRANIRAFPTTSMGRLFDTVAALLGFTRAITFEGQAAMWVEHLARHANGTAAYPFPFTGAQLDYRPLLSAIVRDRINGVAPETIARGFHDALVRAILAVCESLGEQNIVVSGGVFQNSVLIDGLANNLGNRLMTNRAVPPNDGGICLGQAAIAACA